MQDRITIVVLDDLPQVSRRKGSAALLHLLPLRGTRRWARPRFRASPAWLRWQSSVTSRTTSGQLSKPPPGHRRERATVRSCTVLSARGGRTLERSAFPMGSPPLGSTATGVRQRLTLVPLTRTIRVARASERIHQDVERHHPAAKWAPRDSPPAAAGNLLSAAAPPPRHSNRIV